MFGKRNEILILGCKLFFMSLLQSLWSAVLDFYWEYFRCLYVLAEDLVQSERPPTQRQVNPAIMSL
jgi:hypothetical protein